MKPFLLARLMKSLMGHKFLYAYRQRIQQGCMDIFPYFFVLKNLNQFFFRFYSDSLFARTPGCLPDHYNLYLFKLKVKTYLSCITQGTSLTDYSFVYIKPHRNILHFVALVPCIGRKLVEKSVEPNLQPDVFSQ